MTTINAQTIINEVMAAYAIAPSINDEAPSTMVTFKTSEKGSHRICNRKENLQRFADMVRKNAAAFGGGLIREAKARPAVSWPAKLVSLFKQSIEEHDYRAALDIGDKLGALFFVTNKGQALMQVAPVPCDFEPRLSTALNEDGTYAVIFPQNMTSLSGSSVRAKRSRAAQIENVQKAITARTNFNLSEALDKQSYTPVDQAAARAQWILEHGLSAEVIETRIVAHEIESIEAQAAQDVAHVVAQAVATIAISEAMQPAEDVRELVTCEASEGEAQSVTVGSASGATWAPVPQYVPCSLDKTGFNDGPAPAFRGNDGGRDTPPPAEFLGDATPPVAEFLPVLQTYQLPETDAYADWSGAKYSAEFTPNARQQMVIDAVQTALNEGKYYTSDVLARCIEILNIDRDTASMNYATRVEGGIVGMDCYYAREYIKAKAEREASLKTFNEMALREGDELGILVFTDYKRTTGVKITGISEGGSIFTFTGKRGAYTVSGTGSADQLKCGIERAFTTGKRKTDYAAFLATQEKRKAPTPPSVESQPVAPVAVSQPNSEGERIRAAADKMRDQFPAIAAKYDDLATSHDLRDEREARTGTNELSAQNLINAGVHPITAEIVERDGLVAYGPLAQAEILTKLESAKQAQDVPQIDANEWEPAIGERYIGAVEYAAQEANKREDGFEYRTGKDALMERRRNTPPALTAPKGQQIIGKSGKWSASFSVTAPGVYAMSFRAGSSITAYTYATPSERMKALQALARATDAPDDTPPGGGLPCPEPVAAPEPVASADTNSPETVKNNLERIQAEADKYGMQAEKKKHAYISGLFLYQIFKDGQHLGRLFEDDWDGFFEVDIPNFGSVGTFSLADAIAVIQKHQGAPTPPVAVSSAEPTSPVAVSSGFEPVDCDHDAMEATYKAMRKADASASKEIAATAHAKALIDLPAQYPQLKRAENTYAGGKLAAANMRILLKAAFSGVKFSVTSDYNSVRVNWTDGPSDAQVNEVIGRFDIGASDSQSDYFYTVSTAFSELFGGVQYLNTRREVSDSLIQVAIDRLYQGRAEKPTVTDYRKCTGVFEWNMGQYENREMREMLETLGK